MEFRGYDAKADLLRRFVAGRNVLHLGAVGETCGETEARVRHAMGGIHAVLTEASERCVGVDYDEPSVRLLTDRGVFDNLLCADVTELQRDDVALARIDYIVAGDVIEHLANPGAMLDTLNELADPDTRLLLTVPNSLGLVIFLRHLRGREVEGQDHVCSFNLFTIGNLLQRHGWIVDEAWTCYQQRASELHGRLKFQFGLRLFRWQPRLGGTLFVSASRQ